MERRDSETNTLAMLGNAVSKRRRELKLSQEELAERAGLHRTYISDVERGVRNVSLLTLERIAAGLGVSVPALLSMG